MKGVYYNIIMILLQYYRHIILNYTYSVFSYKSLILTQNLPVHSFANEKG